MWDTRNERAPCIFQGQRYAERWCAGRLAPRMRLRAAVARMVDDTPSEPLRPLPALPPTQTAAAGTLLDRGGGEGPGTSKGSAGANPFAGGDEAKGEGPDEDTGEDRSEGTAPGRVSTASSLLRSKSKIAERWELQEIA